MKKTLTFILLGLAVLQSCSPSEDNTNTNKPTLTVAESIDKDQFLADLEVLESKLTVNTPAKEDLQKAVTMFQDYAAIFPTDDLAADYLLKASDVALNLGQHEKSVKLLNRIITEYPTCNKIESVYYNRASHTDFELRDTAQARIYYTEFLEKFPKSDFVDDAQARIEQNFMSLEELIESFMADPKNELVN